MKDNNNKSIREVQNLVHSILSARARRHTGTRAQEHSDYTKFNLHS